MRARLGASQHQSASAHVATTDELDGKMQPLVENLEKNVHIFSSGNAAEQDDLRIRMPLELAGEVRGAEQQRRAIAFILRIDRACRHRAKLFAGDVSVGRQQPAVRRDDVSATQAASWWRIAECVGV